jgi:hypothetical protein
MPLKKVIRFGQKQMAAFQKGSESEVGDVRESFSRRIEADLKGFRAVAQQQDQSLREVSSGLQVTRRGSRSSEVARHKRQRYKPG